jgi:hypothetical protein
MRAWLLAASVLLLTGAAQAQCVSNTNVFNASRDLSHIGQPNMLPNQTNVDSAPLLRAAIAYMLKTPGCNELVVDRGAYSFATTADVTKQRMAYVIIAPRAQQRAITGLTIDLRGSDLIFQESYYSAFYIDQCNRCVVKNFSIDYANLPFTQLDVQKVTWQDIIAVPQTGWPDAAQLLQHQVTVAGGPSNIQFQGFDTRAGLAQYEYTAWPLLMELPPHANPNRIVLGAAGKPQRVIREGDVFIAAARGGGPAIFQENSTGGSFGNIIIYTSGGAGIESNNSQSMVFDAIYIIPKEGRLVSTVAGGIELNGMSGPGNVVQNCTVIGAQDDSIAGNVTVPLVTATATSVSAITLTSATNQPPQTYVFFVNGMTGQTIGGPPNRPKYTLAPMNGSKTQFTVKPPLNDKQFNEFGTSVIYDWDQYASAGNVTIRGNTISNSYLARGIGFSGASGMEITGNIVTGTQQAGVAVDVNLQSKGATSQGPANNTVITNNHLYSTNMGMSGIGTAMLGAIQVMGYGVDGNVLNKQVTQRVVVTGNTVIGTQRTGIWIGNVYGMAVGGNTVANYNGERGLGDLTRLKEATHLADGLVPYVRTGFSKMILGWCVGNPPGEPIDSAMFRMCHPDTGR